MAWPPPVFDTTFDNADPQLDDHPNIHNQINESLNTDFRPQIDANAAGIAGNASNISDNASNLAAHESTTWLPFTAVLTWGGQPPENGPITGPMQYRVRHGVAYLEMSDASIGSNFPGGPSNDTGDMSMSLTGAPLIPSNGSWFVGAGHMVRNASGGGYWPYWCRYQNQSAFALMKYDQPASNSWKRVVSGDSFNLNLSYRTTTPDTP